MQLAQLHARIERLVQDSDKVITAPDIQDAIQQALAVYSKDRPLQRVADVVATGEYHLDVPPQWHASSSVVRMEYPVGAIPARYLDPAEITVYQSLTGPVFHLCVLPAVGAPVRVTFLCPHVADDTELTISEQDAHALACLSASYCCAQLAAHYAQEGSSTINASTVDHNAKTERWASVARNLRKTYSTEIGVRDEVKQAAAGTVVSLEAPVRRRFFRA